MKPVVEAMGASDVNGPLTSATAKPVMDVWGHSRPKPNAPPTPGAKAEENKDSFDYQKKHAMNVGPFITIDSSDAHTYGMPESMFTTLKDMFEAIIAHDARSGVVTPVKSLEVLRNRYDIFRSNLHQDAHEFLNLLLNEIVEEVVKFSKEHQGQQRLETSWVHSLFEGTLTSETRCLSCLNVSQRDEVFLDLSVDLEENSSVTACLAKFSEEEMLCERNKFHCDNCRGLQEAEKRMKIKRLPKILALHLKRFKYIEEQGVMSKLFHRVPYPFHLRLLNTTDDAEDPDKVYELYAIIIHLGSTPTHGHYVAIVKTKHGWTLLDDELVIPVDKSYVRNFFGGGTRHPACAYVLFYQETTAERMREEEDEFDEIDDLAVGDTAEDFNGLVPPTRVQTSPTVATPITPFDSDPFVSMDHTVTPLGEHVASQSALGGNLSRSAPGLSPGFPLRLQEAEGIPIGAMAHSQDQEEVLPELPPPKTLPVKGSLRSSSFKTLRHPSLSFRKRPNLFSKDRNELHDASEEAVAEERDERSMPPTDLPLPTPSESKKSRFSLGRKKSAMM